MILDGHIHIWSTSAVKGPFLEKLAKAGVDGGVVLSAAPGNFRNKGEPFERRLEHVIELCRSEELLFPFLFLNPTEETALEQVDAAVAAGIAGFKIICTHFYPSDPRCVQVYKRIAGHKKPILFHSGILWDGLNASGNYNKPTEFEVLLTVEELRFALAHISWPWTDECTAVYGKFNNATLRAEEFGGVTGEMFIDNTPGTPEIYREEALRRLLFSGYDILQNLFFGADNSVEDYKVDWARNWIDVDRSLYEKFGLDKQSIDNIFANNLLRFIAMEPRR